MEKRLSDSLAGKTPNGYILPFFWQHGEDHETLLEEITAIAGCGIDQVCVESRVHEEFGREQWWVDFGFILEECKKRNMRVWLLDDKRFPTGYACNYIEDHPQLRAVHLRMEMRDFAGPAKACAILPVPVDEDEQIISAVAYRRSGNDGEIMTGEGVPLLDTMKDGLLWWDMPEGLWRIYYLIRTYRTVEHLWALKKFYIDPLNEESCRAMLEAVYEPHYAHFKEYFGNTFAGFFSDEPGFSNDDKHYFSTLGREGMMLPWSDRMPSLLAEALNISEEKVLRLLPALWHGISGETVAIRVCFMEIVTDLFAKNITGMLGNWCRERGVLYIGHIIEDDNAHQRLGCSAGHYFKALKGMDMSGCDIVLHQMIPGYLSMPYMYAGYGSRCNTEFFRYMLPKLASSLAHIDPRKKGRAMCEIFGAFGWAEGVPEMKYLADCMLVGGLNRFVPHAFSPLYPDQDCPPHFYRRGHNAQFECFGKLMAYMQKMSYILSDGIHCADVAVYYNAEAEWSGKKCMLQQDVCTLLTRSQIDYDILPRSTLLEDCTVEGKRLKVNQETYGAVVIPYSAYLPEDVIGALNVLHQRGVPVVYINGKPENAAAVGIICSSEELPGVLRRTCVCSIQTEKPCLTLRYFHITRDGGEVYMLWNEDAAKGIDVMLTVSGTGQAVLYDVWNNSVTRAQQNGERIRIKLAPAQAIVLSFDGQAELPLYDYADDILPEFSADWYVSRCNADGSTEFMGTELKNFAPDMPTFAGTLIYETSFTSGTKLELGIFGEIAQVRVNGRSAGTALRQNERMDLTEFVQNGKNKLRIEVTVNQGYEGRDEFSTYLPLPPMGLLGPVRLG